MRPRSAVPILESLLNLLVLSRKVSGCNKLRCWKWSGCARGVIRTGRRPFVSRLLVLVATSRNDTFRSSCQFELTYRCQKVGFDR